LLPTGSTENGRIGGLIIPSRLWASHQKAVAYLTDLGDYDEDHNAWLYNKASLHGVDSFFN
jgi:hypothetical protein